MGRTSVFPETVDKKKGGVIRERNREERERETLAPPKHTAQYAVFPVASWVLWEAELR